VKRTKCATLRPRLGFLRRNLGLLGLLGVACVVAAHASAAPAPTLFRLTIVGTAHQEWSVTAAAVVTGDCRRTETSAGTRTAAFRTRAPVVVRIAGGRVLPVEVRGILGEVTLVGANTTEEVCGGKGTSKIDDCARTRRAFTGATVHAASPRPGVVAFEGIANVRLATTDCPLEPADVRHRPLGRGSADGAEAFPHQPERIAESAQGLRLAAAGAARGESRMDAEVRTNGGLIPRGP